MERLVNEWDWGEWCENPKQSIIFFFKELKQWAAIYLVIHGDPEESPQSF